MGKLANTVFLWLDRNDLCPHALVERILGTDASPRWDFAYRWGLNACTWICMRLPEDVRSHNDLR